MTPRGSVYRPTILDAAISVEPDPPIRATLRGSAFRPTLLASTQRTPSGRSPTPSEKSSATANRERGIIAHPARRFGRPPRQLSCFRTE